jgi:hypothetical protein
MGLAERRIVKDFQDNYLPVLKKQVDEAARFEVPLEVNWDSLSTDEYPHIWLEAWPKLYFQPLIAALKHITQDEMGREALQETLKKVVVQDLSGAYYGDRWSVFQNGILILDHKNTNADNIKERTDGLINTLEKGL